VVPFALTIIVVCGVWLALVISRQLNRSFPVPQTDDWLFHDQRRPPLWLLSDTRLLYLCQHGEFTRELRIRRRRSRIFRRYLHELKCEFEAISSALKAVMAQSPIDRPDLASRLVRAQVVFYSGVLKTRFRVLRFRFGLR
jgi:hypothetical protein